MIIALVKLHIPPGHIDKPAGASFEAGERLDRELNPQSLLHLIREAKAEDIPDSEAPARIAAIRAQANTDPRELPIFNLDSENIYENKR